MPVHIGENSYQYGGRGWLTITVGGCDKQSLHGLGVQDSGLRVWGLAFLAQSLGFRMGLRF